MNEVKHWLTSKTIVVAAVGILLNLLGAAHIKGLETLVPSDVADNIVGIVNGVLFFGTAVSRLVATKKLTA